MKWGPGSSGSLAFRRSGACHWRGRWQTWPSPVRVHEGIPHDGLRVVTRTALTWRGWCTSWAILITWPLPWWKIHLLMVSIKQSTLFFMTIIVICVMKCVFAGFTNVEEACCELDQLNGEKQCLIFQMPQPNLCKSRTADLFWYFYHPTMHACRMASNGVRRDHQF